MKSYRNRMLAIATLALAAICTSAGKANAQSKATGRFTLPFEAKWGNAVLPVGDYTFIVSKAISSLDRHYFVTFIGKDKETTLIAAKDLSQIGAGNRLVAVRSGGKYRIRNLRLAFADLILNFQAPKAEQTLVAAAPELIQSVPILVATK